MRGHEARRAILVQRIDRGAVGIAGCDLTGGRDLKRVFGQVRDQCHRRSRTVAGWEKWVLSVDAGLQVAQEEADDFAHDRHERAMTAGTGDPLQAGLRRDIIRRVGIERGHRWRWRNGWCGAAYGRSGAGRIKERVKAASLNDCCARAGKRKHVGVSGEDSVGPRRGEFDPVGKTEA